MANVHKSGLGIKSLNMAIQYLFSICWWLYNLLKETKSAARNIQAILKHYCNVSGQLVNYHRSMIQFSKGIERGKSLLLQIFCRYLHWIVVEFFLGSGISILKEREVISWLLRIRPAVNWLVWKLGSFLK